MVGSRSPPQSSRKPPRRSARLSNQSENSLSTQSSAPPVTPTCRLFQFHLTPPYNPLPPHVQSAVEDLLNVLPNSKEAVWQERWNYLLRSIGANFSGNSAFQTNIKGNSLSLHEVSSSENKRLPTLELHQRLVEAIVAAKHPSDGSSDPPAVDKGPRQNTPSSLLVSSEVKELSEAVTFPTATSTQLLKMGVIIPDFAVDCVALRQKDSNPIEECMHAVSLVGELKCTDDITSRSEAAYKACLAKAIIYCLEAFELSGTFLGFAAVDYHFTRILVLSSTELAVETAKKRVQSANGASLPIAKWLNHTSFHGNFPFSLNKKDSKKSFPLSDPFAASDIDLDSLSVLFHYFTRAVNILECAMDGKKAEPLLPHLSKPESEQFLSEHCERLAWRTDADVDKLAEHARPDVLAAIKKSKAEARKRDNAQSTRKRKKDEDDDEDGADDGAAGLGSKRRAGAGSDKRSSNSTKCNTVSDKSAKGRAGSQSKHKQKAATPPAAFDHEASENVPEDISRIRAPDEEFDILNEEMLYLIPALLQEHIRIKPVDSATFDRLMADRCAQLPGTIPQEPAIAAERDDQVLSYQPGSLERESVTIGRPPSSRARKSTSGLDSGGVMQLASP